MKTRNIIYNAWNFHGLKVKQRVDEHRVEGIFIGRNELAKCGGWFPEIYLLSDATVSATGVKARGTLFRTVASKSDSANPTIRFSASSIDSRKSSKIINMYREKTRVIDGAHDLPARRGSKKHCCDLISPHTDIIWKRWSKSFPGSAR